VDLIKITLEKWIFNESVSYKIINIDKCCEEIRQNPLIDFYAKYFENSEDEYGVALCETDTHPEPWEDDYTTDYRYYKINRCPFCGELISIEVAEQLDKTAEYKQLEAEVYDLRKEITKCDSKKRERELEAQFREKNNLLDSYYYNGSIRIDIEDQFGSTL
jgi:hypothetical protein